MYEEFYGFRDNPFRLTPDPEYLFLSANHQEGLAHLLFGVSEGSGVVVITGEIGTGKTTLLRALIRNLDAQTIVAYVFNPALSALELLQTLNADLGLPSTSTSKKELIDELNRFLLAQRTAGQRVVAIIDEAQNLEPAVLEQLRLLSNLETEREKLLQIILAGQPELGTMLARPDLAQLNQRVTIRWHLRPLKANETAAYVRHRLRVTTGGREPVHFTSHALRFIHRFSRGVPRVINAICHRALLISYTREERQVGWAIVRQAAKELRHHRRGPDSLFPRLSPAPVALLVGGLLLLTGGVFAGIMLRNFVPELTPPGSQKTPASQPQAATAPLPAPSVPVPGEIQSSAPSSIAPLAAPSTP
ncbi:MAG: ExeA family protein, partial [Candidatus Binatia bacterium]